MLKVIDHNSCINHVSYDLAPGLSHMCWPGAWAVITALYSLRAEVPEKAWPLFFLVFFGKYYRTQWPTLRSFETCPPRHPPDLGLANLWSHRMQAT